MKETCNVTNRSAGLVVYRIPELNIRRSFNRFETKKNIAVRELEMLTAQLGGPELIYNYLTIDDDEVYKYLINGEPQPEYYIKESELPKWMQECTLPEFQDALDFAPQGTKDLIKKIAVETRLNDYNKRKAILEQLGFDVTVAIEKEEEAKEGTETKEQTPTRRVNKEGEKTASRRSTPTTVITENKE